MAIEQSRRLVSAIPGPKSLALHTRRRAATPAAVSSILPVYIAAAEGAILVDVDGNHFIDFTSGLGASSAGHGAAAIADAVRAQASTFLHTGFAATPYENYVTLAERLNALCPGSFEKRTALFNSGAEAVEAAVKIARKATGRPAVVAFDHAHHGRTNLTLALTAHVQPAKSGFGPFAGEIYRMPSPYPLRWPAGAALCLDEAFEALVMGVHLGVGEENVAAVVFEPIQGEGGVIVPPDGFLSRMSEWCRLHGIVLIADETLTGLGRTGDMFACAHDGVAPDLMVTGGALAAGLPLAAVTGRAALMDRVQDGAFDGVFEGNPVSCAAALAVLECIGEMDLCARARAIEQTIKRRLSRLTEQWDVIGEIRGRGALIAVELTLGGGELNPHPFFATAIAEECHRNGLLVSVCGTYGNCLRLMPPLTIDDGLLDDGLTVLEDAFVTAR
jgi:4-aminobutyrate aminotransferase/(S)-3-amino-2-methylpropionate transaminase